MRNRIIRTIFLSCLTIVAVILLYLNYLSPGITGYPAKYLASGVFVAGRTQESIENEDINFFPVKYAKNHIDFENKEVTSKFLIWKSKVVFNEGLGCTLVRDLSEEAVESIDYPQVPMPECDPDTIPWPAGDLLCDTISSGINPDRLDEILDKAFNDTVNFRGTFAVTVVYRDQIVAERYRDDFSPANRFLSWSMAKSFTSAMVGMMVKDGMINIGDPVKIPEWENDGRSNITLNNLLQMNSGLEFDEKYYKLKLTNTTTMLLNNGDMGEYALSKNLIAEPGTLWSYSSGSSNIVQHYLKTLFPSPEDYLAYPRKALFNRTGMRSVVWETDATGTFVGSSYLYASMRDYARFGLLYLHNGDWLGEQVLPENWVNYTTTPAEGSDGEYGAMFWLNRSGEFKDLPSDMYYCDGYEGQRIFIIPSLNLVIVRTGCSPNGTFDWQTFLKGIVDSVEE